MVAFWDRSLIGIGPWEVFIDFKGSSRDFDFRKSCFVVCCEFMDDLGLPDVDGKSQALVSLSKGLQVVWSSSIKWSA